MSRYIVLAPELGIILHSGKFVNCIKNVFHVSQTVHSNFCVTLIQDMLESNKLIITKLS